MCSGSGALNNESRFQKGKITVDAPQASHNRLILNG